MFSFSSFELIIDPDSTWSLINSGLECLCRRELLGKNSEAEGEMLRSGIIKSLAIPRPNSKTNLFLIGEIWTIIVISLFTKAQRNFSDGEMSINILSADIDQKSLFFGSLMSQ
jgi:hypothetical protein